MAKQKSKNSEYKAGQLITVDNEVYRIKKCKDPLQTCEDCYLSWHDEDKGCRKYCHTFGKTIPVDCNFKKIRPS